MFAQASFWELLATRHPDVVFLGFVIISAVAIVCYFWARVRRADIQARQIACEASLKQDMLNRGMSADDIERVLKTSVGGTTADSFGKAPQTRS
jgi:hypothetical protein